jgi:hypothetical protein
MCTCVYATLYVCVYVYVCACACVFVCIVALAGSLAEGVQGAITGIPNFTVTHMLFATILPLHILITTSYRPCLTNWKFTPKRSPWQLHLEVWGDVLQLQTWQLFASPILWWHTAPLHRHLQIPISVCDRQINLSFAADTASWPFKAGVFRAMTLPTDYMSTPSFPKFTQFLLTCMQFRYGLLPSYDKAEKWTPPYRNGFCLTVLQRNIGVRDTIPSWCVMQECGLESLQFNWFSAAMRLYGPLTQCNSSTMKRVFKLTCNWAPDLLTAGPPTFFQPWKAWHNRTYVNRSCRTVSLLILVSFSWTLGTDI